MKKTIVIQIGNSDDKLSQKTWAKYFGIVGYWVHALADEVHFSGTSNGDSRYQNACFVCVCSEECAKTLRENLREVKEVYHQDSIAWMEGDTKFI